MSSTSSTDWYDRFDEQRAIVRRQQLGPRGWLVSWTRVSRRDWMARLSGPELPETVEAISSSRCTAIARAEIELSRRIMAEGKLDLARVLAYRPVRDF